MTPIEQAREALMAACWELESLSWAPRDHDAYVAAAEKVDAAARTHVQLLDATPVTR